MQEQIFTEFRPHPPLTGEDCLAPIYSELLESSHRVMSAGSSALETDDVPLLGFYDPERPARETGKATPLETDDPECPARGIRSDRVHGETVDWTKILEAHQRPCPGNEDVVLLARDWRNHNLRFNPEPDWPPPRNGESCCAAPAIVAARRDAQITYGWSCIIWCTTPTRVPFRARTF
jgi:hypothetical protein